MKILFCGGRNVKTQDVFEWMNTEFANAACEKLNVKAFVLTTIIHGAARGADSAAGKWAKANNIPTEEYPANWGKYGKSAGHIRNQQMLDEGKPDLVIAFPGGKGTAGMIKITQKANIPLLVLK